MTPAMARHTDHRDTDHRDTAHRDTDHRDTDALPLTIPLVVRRAAARFGDRDALVDGNERWSFSSLAAAAETAGRAFIAAGLAAGDRVAIWAPNVAEWAVAALGVYTAGCVVVPLNTRFKGSEAGHVLRASGARMLLTVTDFLDTDYLALLDGVGGLDALEHTVVLRGRVPPGSSAWPDLLAGASAVASHELESRVAALDGDDTSDILFTSGTTGAPKGAMLTHGASIRAYWSWSEVVGLQEDDRYLVVNPFFHAFGLKAGILASLLRGATVLPQPVFDVPEVMRRVHEEHVTMLPGPPAVYQTMLNHPDRASFDLSSLRLAVTGAASIPVELIVRMREELPFETVVTGYGLTEATGIATMCRHDDDPDTIATTVGRPIPGVEVRVVDDGGRTLAAGEPGEVLVRGYNLMKGYLDDPQATAEAIDPDGWLHTGDVGVFDGRGNLAITDRKKDMFIVGGFNAYPAEIEGIMLQHPAVAQVAVVGIPDERLGEVGAAFVVPRTGDTVDPDALIAWCREHMANYKAPRRVALVAELPLNASGKVLKYELRARAAR
jgi:acyl-CoA synthetase (AMP-forming)/AMP-acid ligase II